MEQIRASGKCDSTRGRLNVPHIQAKICALWYVQEPEPGVTSESCAVDDSQADPAILIQFTLGCVGYCNYRQMYIISAGLKRYEIS